MSLSFCSKIEWNLAGGATWGWWDVWGCKNWLKKKKQPWCKKKKNSQLEKRTISRVDSLWVWDIFLPASQVDLHLLFDMPVLSQNAIHSVRRQPGEHVYVCFRLLAYTRLRRASKGLLSYTTLRPVGSAMYGTTETFLCASHPPPACTRLRALRGSHAPRRRGSDQLKKHWHLYLAAWRLIFRECCTPNVPYLIFFHVAMASKIRNRCLCSALSNHGRRVIVLLNTVHFSEIGQKCSFEISNSSQTTDFSPFWKHNMAGWGKKTTLFVLASKDWVYLYSRFIGQRHTGTQSQPRCSDACAEN